MRGAILEAEKLLDKESNAWMPRQFENPPIRASMRRRLDQRSGPTLKAKSMSSSPLLVLEGQSQARLATFVARIPTSSPWRSNPRSRQSSPEVARGRT